MSMKNCELVQYRKKDNVSNRSSVVKSLILEFEQLTESNQIGMTRMGSEQSCTSKHHTNLKTPSATSSTLVKKRVTQFDLDNVPISDKRRRQKSTSEASKNQRVLSKDFQRSKSVDWTRTEKDRYSRSRQVTPKLNKDTDRLVNPYRRALSSNDSNNNDLQRASSRKKTNLEASNKVADIKEEKVANKVPTNKQQKVANIKTSQRLTKRFDISENTLEETRVKKFISKASLPRENKDESKFLEKNKQKKIRSVKSIRKVFETVPKCRPLPIVSKENSISEVYTSRINHTEVNKSKDSKTAETDDHKHTEEFTASSSNNCHCDSNENISTNPENLECFRQSIINNITREFELLKMLDQNETNNNDDEFNEIEFSMQEMQKTIKEMQRRHSSELMSEECTDAVGSTEEKKDDVDKQEQNHLTEAETVNIYLSSDSIPEQMDEDEFGKRSLSSLDNSSYTEAYNREGDELIITKVGAVEHRTISENFTTRESLASLEEVNSEDDLENTQEDLPNEEFASIPKISEDSNSPDISENQQVTEIHPVSEQDIESGIASNRSTFYSNTNTNSTDSIGHLSKTESEEGAESEKDVEPPYQEVKVIEENVEIRKNFGDRYDRALKTETTIYDSFKNPRIAKVCNINSSDYIPQSEASTLERIESPKSPPAGLKPKKDYIIEELIDTEKKYIKHLEGVVWDYMPVITDGNLPSSLIGKSPYLFGNIKKIYNTTRKFYAELKRCGNDHEEIAKTFLNFKHLFELYPLYSKNKPVADLYLLGDFKDVVTIREKELNDRLGLASNLLTPIQRLGKYILFLEQIQKELRKNGGVESDNIYKAIETVRKQMSRGNDFIAIDSIKECPISLSEQGSFVMREKFNVIKPRKYEAMLFLFEEILVFTTVDPRNPEMFVYRESIKLNEMGIVTFDDQPLVFHLKRFPSYKKGPKEHHEFVIEAKKNKDKKTWTEQIEKRLWVQLVKCKEKQRELHNNQGMRNSVVELPNRVRKKKAGYSSLPSEMRKNPPSSIFYYKITRDA